MRRQRLGTANAGGDRAELFTNHRQQPFGVERLDEIFGAAPAGLGLQHRIRVASDDDGGNPVLTADDELQSVEGPQPYVGDEQVRGVVAEQVTCFLEGPGRDDRITRIPEHLRQSEPGPAMVVNDENGCHRWQASTASPDAV